MSSYAIKGTKHVLMIDSNWQVVNNLFGTKSLRAMAVRQNGLFELVGVSMFLYLV